MIGRYGEVIGADLKDDGLLSEPICNHQQDLAAKFKSASGGIGNI